MQSPGPGRCHDLWNKVALSLGGGREGCWGVGFGGGSLDAKFHLASDLLESPNSHRHPLLQAGLPIHACLSSSPTVFQGCQSSVAHVGWTPSLFVGDPDAENNLAGIVRSDNQRIVKPHRSRCYPRLTSATRAGFIKPVPPPAKLIRLQKQQHHRRRVCH